jgi:hypothetical protein
MTKDFLNNYFSKFPFAELRSQDGASCFKISTYSYAYPDADNEYDADWHQNYLLLTIPAFRAEINEIIINGCFLSNCLEQLREFSTLGKSKIEIEPLEPYFGLFFSFNARKNVIINGYIQYPIGNGATLEFEFETDLTYVDKFIHGIESILKQFPAKR